MSLAASTRDMTRLVFWYLGVQLIDLEQAYSFLPASKIIPYEAGRSKGYCDLPKKIQNKIENQQSLTKAEEHLKLTAPSLDEVVRGRF